MTRPDLSTDEGVKAYRAELRAFMRRWRLAGFLLILGGAALIAPAYFVWNWPHQAIWAGYAAVAAGWVIFLAVIFLRTRHHRRRMAENP